MSLISVANMAGGWNVDGPGGKEKSPQNKDSLPSACGGSRILPQCLLRPFPDRDSFV